MQVKRIVILKRMKLSAAINLLLTLSSATSTLGFSPTPAVSSFVSKSSSSELLTNAHTFQLKQNNSYSNRCPSLSMSSYTVGVVGATGAVGKEIVSCLNKSSLDVSKLRIFGSARSAGSTRDAGKFGSVNVELFDVEKARECDVVFLAVSGDFSKEYARVLTEGDDGVVVIDNSVSSIM